MAPDEPLTVNVPRLKKLLHDLVGIYSPSGKEQDVLEWLERYFRKWKLPFETIEVDKERYDLLVRPDAEHIPLLFTGHVDTVPAYDLGDFGPDEEDGQVSGLGTADMKAGCAAMIEAFIRFVETRGRLPGAALALVVGEEETGDGTNALLREHRFPWALVAEPTSLAPCLCHYGYLEIQLNTFGKRKHASVGASNQNAIYTMLQLLLNITKKLESDALPAIYNIRDMHSADSGYAVPDRCTAWLDLHLPPKSPIGSITCELEELVYSLVRDRPGDPQTLAFDTIHSGFELPEKGYLPELLKQTFETLSMPWHSTFFPSHSDANLLWQAGVKPVMLGPGDLDRAHSEEESVPFAQVEQAAKLYYQVLIEQEKNRGT